MKIINTITGLIMAAITATIISGCSAGATGTMKPNESGEYEPFIEYNSAQIQSRLSIVDIRQRTVGNIMQVSADLHNSWKWKLDFQYKFKFYDKDGFEVNPDGRQWAPIVIAGNEVSTVQAVAPNPSAITFKIIVRD